MRNLLFPALLSLILGLSGGLASSWWWNSRPHTHPLPPANNAYVPIGRDSGQMSWLERELSERRTQDMERRTREIERQLQETQMQQQRSQRYDYRR